MLQCDGEAMRGATTFDPWVRLALAVGGGNLVKALGNEEKTDAEAPGKLFVPIRMSTRSTPYGIFAGVALGKFADATDVLIDDSGPIRRARPDMEWLLSLVGELETRLKFGGNSGSLLIPLRLSVPAAYFSPIPPR